MKLARCRAGNACSSAAFDRDDKYPLRRTNCANGTSDGAAIRIPRTTATKGWSTDFSRYRLKPVLQKISAIHAPYAIAAGYPARAYASAMIAIVQNGVC